MFTQHRKRFSFHLAPFSNRFQIAPVRVTFSHNYDSVLCERKGVLQLFRAGHTKFHYNNEFSLKCQPKAYFLPTKERSIAILSIASSNCDNHPSFPTQNRIILTRFWKSWSVISNRSNLATCVSNNSILRGKLWKLSQFELAMERIAIDLNNNDNDNNNNNFHRKMLTCSQVLRSFLNVVTEVA